MPQTTQTIKTLLSGDALYDEIMGQIEPELVSAVYPTLDEKYKNETPEEKEARKARYQKAFAEYEQKFSAYSAQWDASLHALQAVVLTSVEHSEKQDDDAALLDLETSIASL